MRIVDVSTSSSFNPQSTGYHTVVRVLSQEQWAEIQKLPRSRWGEYVESHATEPSPVVGSGDYREYKIDGVSVEAHSGQVQVADDAVVVLVAYDYPNVDVRLVSAP